MKRILIALLVGGIVAGAVFAAAANLGVSSNNLGAGDDDVASCDTDGVTTGYTVTFVNDSGYEVNDVTVSGIDANCDDQAIAVTLTQDGDKLAEKSGSVDESVTAGSETFSFASDHIAAADVNDVHVVITGVPAA